MPGGDDRESVRLADSSGGIPWTPAVGVGGWLLSLAAVLVAAPVIAGSLMLAGLDTDTITVGLIPLPPIVTGLVAVAIAAAAAGSSTGMLFGAARARLQSILAGVGLGVAAFVLFNVVLGLVLVYALQLFGVDPPEVQPGLRDAAERPEALPVLILSTTIAAPIGEELLYRGLLFQSLLNRFRPAAAMWLSAIAFGAGHVTVGVALLSNLTLAVLIVPLGVVLAWSFHRWGNLWVPIAVHAVFNAITVLLMSLGMA